MNDDSSVDETAIGEILVRRGMCTREQVEACLALVDRLRQSGGPVPSLITVLTEKGHLSEGDAEKTLRLDPETPGTATDLQKRYDLILNLGRDTWKAQDRERNEIVVLKFLKGASLEDVTRLRREARAAMRLSHRHIATVFAVGRQEEKSYVAMEFVDGRTIDKLPNSEPRNIVKLIRDAADAVQAAHKAGILHGHLGADNLLVDGNDRVFVLNFGMGPERDSPTVHADIHDLGATLKALLPEATGDLRRIIRKCMEEHEADRYETAELLAGDLTRWLKGEAVTAREVTRVTRLRRQIAKRKPLAVSVAVATVLVLILALWIGPMVGESIRKKREAENRAAAEDRADALVRNSRKGIASLDAILGGPDWTRDRVQSVLSKARRGLDQALEEVSDHRGALLEQARLHMLTLDADAALKVLDRLIASNPEHAEAYRERVVARMEILIPLRHPPGIPTLTDSRRAHEVETLIESDLVAYRRLAGGDTAAGFRDGAMKFLRGDFKTSSEILRRHAEDGAARRLAGHALLHLGKVGESAVETLDSALRLRPPPVGALLDRAEVHRRTGDFTKAAADIDALLAIAPGHLPALQAEARIQVELGNTKQAVDLCNGILERYAEDTFTLVTRGMAKAASGAHSDAVDDYTEAIRLRGGYTDAYYRRAVSSAVLEDRDTAHLDLNIVLQREPENVEALILRGTTLLLHVFPEKVEKDLRTAVRLAPKRADAHHLLAEVCQAKKKYAEALKHYTISVGIDPRSIRARSGSSLANSGLRNFDEAEKIARALIRDHPDHPQGYFCMAAIYMTRLDLDQSLQWMNRAVAKSPDEERLLYHRGLVYSDMSRHREAIADMTESIKRCPTRINAWKVRAVNQAYLKNWQAAILDMSRALELGGADWDERQRAEDSIKDWKRRLEDE